MAQNARLSTAFVSPLLGPSLGLPVPQSDSASRRKSLVNDMEEYFTSSLQKKEIQEKTAKSQRLSEIVSIVSKAIGNEKQGISHEQIEVEFSKASSKIESVLTSEEVIDDKLIKDWLSMLNFLIIKHLQEVVNWVDADVITKDPLRSLKNENRDLKEDVASLQKIVEDLQLELDTYKRISPRKDMSSPGVIFSEGFNLRTSFSKSSHNQGASSSAPSGDDEERLFLETSERIMESLAKATHKLQELKSMDQELMAIIKREPVKNSLVATSVQPFMIRGST